MSTESTAASQYGVGNRVIIIDAGSSKTHAAVFNRISGIIEERLVLSAINPMIISDDEMTSRLRPLSDTLTSKDDVAFFGAGCLPGNPSERVANSLRNIGAEGTLTVQSDVVAAALSLFGGKTGISCILGTGSNTALTIDGKIESSVPSLGYVLGDEGSGSALGKRLIRAIFRGDISKEIRDSFLAETSQSLHEVLQHVYREATPNRYLAGFTHFLADHIEGHEIRRIVRDEFSSLFVNQITRISDYRYVPIGFVGSVAKVFEEHLRHVALEFQCNIETITASPIEGLIEYFKNCNK